MLNKQFKREILISLLIVVLMFILRFYDYLVHEHHHVFPFESLPFLCWFNRDYRSFVYNCGC